MSGFTSNYFACRSCRAYVIAAPAHKQPEVGISYVLLKNKQDKVVALMHACSVLCAFAQHATCTPEGCFMRFAS